jgi:hypothetical protein
MVVAVVAVGVVQVPIDEIVDVIAMGHRLVAASRTMHVTRLVPAALVRRRTGIRVLRRHLDRVFIDVARVHVVQVAVVQIVHVVTMLHGGMAAAGSMLMGVVGVVGLFAVCHVASPKQSVQTT